MRIGLVHQDGRFAVAPIELVRDVQQHPLGIVAARLELVDGAGGLPQRAAFAQIGDESR